VTAPVELPDEEKRFDRLRHAHDAREVRHGLIGLGTVLGPRTADLLERESGPLREVLCVVVLRGGALLYPGFAAAFPHADFLMLGMRRAADGRTVDADYITEVPRTAYRTTVYIDCVAATGGTLLAARRLVAARCDPGREYAAVVSGAAVATGRLEAAGVRPIGFSLYEELDGRVVTPDMGEFDAGDLFSGVVRHPPPGGPGPR
jgi:hypothetical protein